MTYDDAMTQMKQGHAARREGWNGYVRIEGMRLIRVRPDRKPSPFRASPDDRAASDWVASDAPTTAEVRA